MSHRVAQGNFSITQASADDAAALAELAEQTFRDTFTADNKSSDIDLYCLAAFSEATQRAEIEDPSIDTLLMREESNALVAYAQLRAGHAPVEISGASPIELVRFYVVRSRHGSGLAARLMTEVFETARARQAGTIWLGVWERNNRAQAFYRKFGFHDVGAHQFLLGRDVQVDRLMAHALQTDHDSSAGV